MTTTIGARRRDERGAASVLFAVIALALFAVVGLVVDGGAGLRANRAADHAASEAARAASQHITGGAISGSPPRLAGPAAAAAARSYLDAAGVSGTVNIRGDTVHVSTTTTEPTVILSVLGFRSSITATGEATVALETGF